MPKCLVTKCNELNIYLSGTYIYSYANERVIRVIPQPPGKYVVNGSLDSTFMNLFALLAESFFIYGFLKVSFLDKRLAIYI